MLRTIAAASCTCASRVSLPAAARPVGLRSPGSLQPSPLPALASGPLRHPAAPTGMAAAAATGGREPAPPAAAAAGGSGNGGSSPDDPLLQYVVLRRDLWTELEWPLGSVVAQGCHAATAALWLTREAADTQQYCAEANLDHMHKVRWGGNAASVLARAVACTGRCSIEAAGPPAACSGRLAGAGRRMQMQLWGGQQAAGSGRRAAASRCTSPQACAVHAPAQMPGPRASSRRWC